MSRRLNEWAWRESGLLVPRAKPEMFTCGPAFFGSGASFAYTAAVVVDHTKVSGGSDLSNFPMLFYGTYANLATVANGGKATSSSGYDIVFTSDAAGNNLLAFERVSWSATTGAVQFWVKIPTLSASADTMIYLQVGKSSIITDQQNKTGTWSENYISVCHMEGNSADSLAAVTPTDSNMSYVSGLFGQVASFNGTSSEINFTNSNIYLPANLTWSAWIYINAYPSSGNWKLIEAFANDSFGHFVQFNSNGLLNCAVNDADSGGTTRALGGTVLQGAWTRISFTWINGGGAVATSYINGAQAATQARGASYSLASSQPGVAQKLGKGDGVSPSWFNGLLDEVSWSSAIRTAGWIATEYSNQSSPSTFYSLH